MNKEQKVDFFNIINRNNVCCPIDKSSSTGKVVTRLKSGFEMSYVIFSDNTCLVIDSYTDHDDRSEVEFVDIDQIDPDDYFGDWRSEYEEAAQEWYEIESEKRRIKGEEKERLNYLKLKEKYESNI